MSINVSDVMTRYPVSVKPSTNLLECAKTMIKKRVGSLLLVENKRLVGFISEKDILWAIVKKSKEDLPSIRAIDISPRKLATIRPDASIEEAMNKMKKLKFQRLPVISDGELVGIITSRDILNFSPEFYPELEEVDKIREEAAKLKRIKKAKMIKSMVDGLCEECGNRGMLQKTDGLMICEGCRSAM